METDNFQQSKRILILGFNKLNETHGFEFVQSCINEKFSSEIINLYFININANNFREIIMGMNEENIKFK